MPLQRHTQKSSSNFVMCGQKVWKESEHKRCQNHFKTTSGWDYLSCKMFPHPREVLQSYLGAPSLNLANDNQEDEVCKLIRIHFMGLKFKKSAGLNICWQPLPGLPPPLPQPPLLSHPLLPWTIPPWTPPFPEAQKMKQ